MNTVVTSYLNFRVLACVTLSVEVITNLNENQHPLTLPTQE